jgi:DNA-binding winged helix-turn-helix (wHTH) protein
VDMVIVRLRRKLAAAGITSVAIDTVRGRGYRLVERGSSWPRPAADETLRRSGPALALYR